MTREQEDQLLRLLERIERRHCHKNTKDGRLLREAATWQDAEQALALIRLQRAHA